MGGWEGGREDWWVGEVGWVRGVCDGRVSTVVRDEVEEECGEVGWV